MAVHGRPRRMNGHEFPPSSMIATHVVNRDGTPNLTRNMFSNLLEESLGTDDQGRPNLSEDETVNYKLIQVVVQVGIDPFVLGSNDDPFRMKIDAGRNVSQLISCLDVLHLVILRTPRILFRIQDQIQDDHSDDRPLYVSLIPKLLALATHSENTEINTKAADFVSKSLQADECETVEGCQAIAVFLQDCLAALLRYASSRESWHLDDTIDLQDDYFKRVMTNDFSYAAGIPGLLKLQSFSHLLTLATRLLTSLARQNCSVPHMIRLRKHAFGLERILEDADCAENDISNLESLRAQIGSLEISASCAIPSSTNNNDDNFMFGEGRERKRIKLSTENGPIEDTKIPQQQVHLNLTRILTGRAVPDLAGLPETAQQHFKTMSDVEQCKALKVLGHAACLLDANVADEHHMCTICDTAEDGSLMIDHTEQVNELFRTIYALRSYYDRRSTVRLAAIAAFRRLVSHTHSAEHLNLTKSIGGQLCLQSLRNTSRDARLMAAHALQSFVSCCSNCQAQKLRDSTLIHDNRVALLEYLQALWQNAQPSQRESFVVALTCMAKVVGEEELNIILVRLVELLGHSSVYVGSLVTSEIQQLAQHLQLPVAALLRPFWRTLSIIVVKNFTSRPVIAQQLCDLLGMPLTGLLQIMEEHAMPYLTLTGNRDLIGKIAMSGSSPTSLFDVCFRSNNFPKILAFLLIQSFPDPEQTITDTLVAISDDFKEQDLAGWLMTCPSQITFELLRYIGDAGQGKASKTYQGLQTLAQLTTRRTTSSGSSRRNDCTASFLESYALAILIVFANKLDDTEVREPIVEKKRSLIALGELVRLGRSRVKVALPQICACLRSALDNPELCNAAFSAWATMISSVGEEELLELIEQTLAVLIRCWNLIDNRRQQQAVEMLQNLLKKHFSIFRDAFDTIPSLASLPSFADFENAMSPLKKQLDERRQMVSFVTRLQDENLAVVEQALQELVPLLQQKSDFLQRSAMREQPDSFLADLVRALLDCCVHFNTTSTIVLLGGKCLGAIGCLDPTRIESVREKPSFTFLSNFAIASETTGFLMFFMEQVLVQEYLSASSLRSKGFLGWALQELLKLCKLSPESASRTRIGGLNPQDQQWTNLLESTRLVLTPFLTSKFQVPVRKQDTNCSYPFFNPAMTYKQWLTEVTLDFLNRGAAQNVDMIFEICGRLVVFAQGTAISSFLLPYAALNLLLNGIESDRNDLLSEIKCVLKQPLNGLDLQQQDVVRQCSQSIFDMLDYKSVWLQEKRKWYQSLLLRAERGIRDPGIDSTAAQIDLVDSILRSIPADILTQRATECRSYSRALYHWEQHIHSLPDPTDADYRRLQDIYAQIDEPDGIEGISAQIHVLDTESQVLEHKKAGRWLAAQNWYETKLNENPEDTDVQINLFVALKESGQHDVLVNCFDKLIEHRDTVGNTLRPFAIESAWSSNRWDKLSEYVSTVAVEDFPSRVGAAMIDMKSSVDEEILKKLDVGFERTAAELNMNSTVSLLTSHESRLRLHVMEDLRIITECSHENRAGTLSLLDKRLLLLGTNVADKQYLLSIHRACMNLRSNVFSKEDISCSWLTTAKLARKAFQTDQAFNAVLKSSALGNQSATIELAKLTFKDGDHRKAIKTLEGAIISNVLTDQNLTNKESMTMTERDSPNDTTAKAHVLLGKWLDLSGQTQSEVIIKTFRKSTEHNRNWEKGWYYLGRHYNKILESEKLKPPGKESQQYLSGEAVKVVIDNYLKALACGNKYLFQTLPKVLTLWLELVSSADLEMDARRGNSKFHEHNNVQKKKVIEATNASVKKYIDRLQPVAFYTILPQVVARICHHNTTVYNILQAMVVKVVRSFPQQSLWTVMAMIKSSDKVRATRGHNIISKILDLQKKDPKTTTSSEMKTMITASQRFSDEILRVADFHIENKVSKISLARDLGFNHKITPSKLVVPSETCLIPNIPTLTDPTSVKAFRPFSKDPITIMAFVDDALVLSSLQKPRKLSIRGSDGNMYGVLAKPKDDLRKDQRLMEFNTMINRFLKHDIEASRRRLYIRTYAVTPLNEECGLIEWVDNLKTMRDILLKLYRERNIAVEYSYLRKHLDDICATSKDKAKDFTDLILSRYPAVLRMWFIETFPDPTAWFNARIRYTRSSAVMSIVGHVLGLGDRHGENILFVEDNGSILHVDFNCLFDKGMTFDKPECVPFRLTHNMIDAFGTYGYDGPFRHCCEITLGLLRSNEDGLMTILETFLHDPTTDFMTAGKRKKGKEIDDLVPDTAEKMLEGVRGKLRGMLLGESVPLSVGGYVDEMIKQAADRANLARMYIGWCAFL